MLIACDIDGVLAALHEEWYRRYNADYDDDLTVERVTSWDLHHHVKPECGRRIYEYLTAPDLYDAVPPLPGAVVGVAALRELGHQILFVTTNAYGMTDAKAAWLQRHGFAAAVDGSIMLPAELVVAANKNAVDARLLIDDAAHAVRRWVEDHRRPSILFSWPWNQRLEEDVPSAFWSWAHRVSSWREIVGIVERLGEG